MLFPVLVYDREQVLLTRQPIDLVEQQESRRAGISDKVESKSIARLGTLGYIGDQQNQIAALQRLAYLGHHLASERTVRPVHSGRIEQNNLAARSTLLFGNMHDA